MDWIALGIAIVGIILAVAIPLGVEYQRRPRLRIERADDSNQRAPGMANWRIVHVKVVNDPISGFLAKWLLRNTATGCRVRLHFRSRSDGTELRPVRGSWSATPQPIQYVFANESGRVTVTPFWDPEKEPARFTYDVSPGSDGEVVAVAIKHDGENEAYAFGPEIYHAMPEPLKNPTLRLPDTEYEVAVHAEAGEITCDATFTLHNNGSAYTGLSLTES